MLDDFQFGFLGMTQVPIQVPIQVPTQVPTQLDAAIAVVGILFSTIAVLRIPRQDLDRLPLSGLLLLLLFYTVVGWVLAVAKVSGVIWLSVLAAGLMSAIVSSLYLGQAGLVALILAGIGAIAMFFAPNPTAQTARLSAIGLGLTGIWLWAVGGARYRMERTGFRRSAMQWMLILAEWEGLWIGWSIDTFIAPQMGDWLLQLGLI